MTAPTLDQLLAQARHVGELAAQHAPTTERERRLAAPAAEALLESGLRNDGHSLFGLAPDAVPY